jgi:ketosteroid isomerase-like protein
MSEQDNLTTIKTIYDAFRTGDVETILAAVADDVDWGADGNGGAAPWYGIRRSKAEVGRFFADVAGAADVLDFTPLAYGTSEDGVFALIRFGARYKSTGREVSMNLHHYFRFADGKIVYYRGSEDTAQTAAALAS